jgi:hypothetical protein
VTPASDVELVRQAYQIFREIFAAHGRRAQPAELLDPEDFAYIAGWARRVIEDGRDLREIAEHVTAHVACRDRWDADS